MFLLKLDICVTTNIALKLNVVLKCYNRISNKKRSWKKSLISPFNTPLCCINSIKLNIINYEYLFSSLSK